MQLGSGAIEEALHLWKREYPNILKLVEVMMCLLFSYSSLERVLNLLTTICQITIEKSMIITENSAALT